MVHFRVRSDCLLILINFSLEPFLKNIIKKLKNIHFLIAGFYSSH